MAIDYRPVENSGCDRDAVEVFRRNFEWTPTLAELDIVRETLAIAESGHQRFIAEVASATVVIERLRSYRNIAMQRGRWRIPSFSSRSLLQRIQLCPRLVPNLARDLSRGAWR